MFVDESYSRAGMLVSPGARATCLESELLATRRTAQCDYTVLVFQTAHSSARGHLHND